MRTSLLMIATAALLSACDSKDRPTADAGTGGTFVIASIGEAVHVFPPLVRDINGAMVQTLVFDKLAEIGPDLSSVGDKGFTPRLAKSWTWAPDSLSIAFSLDPRARWHDGKPVTASDIRYSFKLFTDSVVGSPTAPLLANIDSVSVRDSATAVVWFRKRTPEQFFDIAYQLVPVPEHVYGAVPHDQMQTSDAVRNVVGSGQFRFVKWDPKVRIELIADTANYRGRPKFDRIVVTPVSDPVAGMSQVLTEQVDFTQSFPIDQLPTLDSSRVARPFVSPTLSYTFLGFNRFEAKSKTAPHPLFADLRVRRALAMGVDRVGMLRNVFGDKGRLGHGPFPMALSTADSTIKLPPYDTTAAKALLDSAGWRAGASGVREKAGRPLRFTIITPTTSLTRKQYAVLLQEQFRKLGAQVEVEVMDGASWNARTNGGDFDVSLISFQPDANIAGARQNWGTAGIGGQNSLRYSNARVDALLDSAAASFDAARARSAVGRAYQQIADDVPAVFLYDVVIINALHKRVNPAATRPDGWWANLAEWSIAPDKRIDRDRIGLAPAKP